MYERGLRMTTADGAEVLVKVVEPYFDRNYQHFSSHAQTPPVKNASKYAAAVRCGNVITIAYPIFKAYGTHGNLPYRKLVQNCIDLLMPNKLVNVDGPSTMEVTVMRKTSGARRGGARSRKPADATATIVHLLQFVAERRTDVLDIVEDIVPVYNVPVSLRADTVPSQVYLAPTREPVEFEYAGGRVNLHVPIIEGHQMVVIE
jgi:hypothetical protein